jgi:hypothetical protein
MSDLSGIVLVRTLKASPVPSSSELIGDRAHGQCQGTGWGEVAESSTTTSADRHGTAPRRHA